MIKQKSKYIRIILYIFLLISLNNCSTKKSESDNTITLAFLPINASSPLFVAIEKHFFEQEGITVKTLRVASANDAISAMLSGRADGAISIGFTSLFTLQNKESHAFKIIQSAFETKNNFTSRILVPKSSRITTLSQLKGKTIGTYNGLTQLLNLKLILEANGFIVGKNINIVQVDEKLQLPSLASGRFDALFTIDPYATIAINEGIAKSILDSPRNEYIISPFPTCATIVSQKLIEKNIDLIKKLIKILDKAVEWSELNPLEVADIVANQKYTSLTRQLSRNVGTYKWWKYNQEKTSIVQEFADIMLNKGLLEKKCIADSMFLKLN